MILSIIGAIGKNNEIGKKNDLLWSLPADMKHFREKTSLKTIVMGQKTYESIGRSLPNRRNIILSQDTSFKAKNTEIIYSISELDDLLKNNTEEVFIIGGGMIYKLFIDKADKLYITHVEGEFKDADTFFPEIDLNKWQKIKSEKHLKDEKNNYNLEFAEYIKKV